MLYKKIDASSVNTVTSALNVFDLPPTNVAINSRAYREYLTLNPLTSKPYHFKIHSSSSFIDLSKAYIFTEMRIVKEGNDGNLTILEADENVAPIQMIGSTFIKNLKISINNQEIFDANSLYSYKSYFDTELSFSNSAKNTHLNACGYYKDDLDQNAITNNGFIERKNLFSKSKKTQFISKIDADLFNQELYLVNNVEIDIEITPHDDDFLIISPNNTKYKVEILNCSLFVKTVELMDSLSIDFNKRLDQSPATYAIRKSVLKSLFITEGRREYNANLFTEQIPRRIIIALVGNGAYVGSSHKSPFLFEHFNVRDITISANGRNYPNVLYNLDYSKDEYVRAFYDLYEAIGYTNTTEDNGISRKMYKNGWAVYCFNMTNSLENDQYFELIKNGTSCINIKFSQQVPLGGITMIAYMECDGILMIDKNRTLSSDISV